MARIYGKYGPARPWLGKLSVRLFRSGFKRRAANAQFYTPDSEFATKSMQSMREKLLRGEVVYLVGIGPGNHNAGVSLVEASMERGIRLLSNHEEERFSGNKHGLQFPALSIEALKQQLVQLGLRAEDLHAALATFNFVNTTGLGWLFEEAPKSLQLLYKKREKREERANQPSIEDMLYKTAAKLGEALGLHRPMPIIGMRHHDNHAAFSYAVSPFAKEDGKVMIAVIDGSGDDGAVSLYVGENGKLEMVYNNESLFDSLGTFYAFISSTQGGWTTMSSEGRYMGASAWGNNDRMTNPYYRQLRQIFYFSNDGRVLLNRALANWHVADFLEPYTPELREILGEPIAIKDMWNPDAVLSVDNINHADITRDRLDKAAATQMVFEDALFHIIGHFIRQTGSHKLVLTGGTALNCIANMRLLEHFNQEFFRRYLGQEDTQLHLWIPPAPGDAGVPIGAAYAFAMNSGAPVGDSLQHAFYCGFAPKTSEILQAFQDEPEIGYEPLGNTSDPEQRKRLADLLAYIIAQEGVVGLYQGVAETGPRALGHRSILSNPTNLHTRDNLNALVKFRELVRPLAPMATLEAAQKWFVLQEGASDDQYNAYNYMILTARARAAAFDAIPAVIHHDGTGRVQIVRPETDPFTHDYLQAMGRRVGAEVSVNTSLNVGGPIVQSPLQALQTLKKSKGMHALFMIGEEGDLFLVWHDIEGEIKDKGRTLNKWLADWRTEMSDLQLKTANV